MMKRLIVILACLGLAFQVVGCTSKESQADAAAAGNSDSADLEKLEKEPSSASSGDDSIISDQLSEEALGENPAPANTANASPSSDGITQSEDNAVSAAMVDSTPVASTDTLPADPLAETPSADMPAPPPLESVDVSGASSPSQEKPITDLPSNVSESTTIVDNPPAEKKANVSLQKVALAPWKVGKKWLNTVYFARPGDTLSGISQMIYGANKVSDLKKANPTLKSRGVKPGDKVYYNSPNRPDDSAKMITYYEDNGMPSETYVAKNGDNVKKLSKSLLGYKDAWKEIWSSNSFESKGEIAEGTEIRYWKNAPPASAPIAQETPAEVAPSMPSEVPNPSAEAAVTPPPPQPTAETQQTASAEIPPPPPQSVEAQKPPEMDSLPPPPPPIEAVNPPAPKAPVEEEAGDAENEEETKLAMAVVGLAAAGGAILIVMRKKRKQRELEMGLDNTHVGT